MGVDIHFSDSQASALMGLLVGSLVISAEKNDGHEPMLRWLLATVQSAAENHSPEWAERVKGWGIEPEKGKP